jgi:hypothetical protein
MSDGLITETDLREIFDISVDIKPGRITRHLTAAGRQMRVWVGDEAYDDALLDAPTDATRKEDLELAEAHLAMSFAVLGINTALRARGIVQTETVEGKTIVRYHSPKEIVDLQQAFFDTARSLADPYLVIETLDEPIGVVVGDRSSSDCEAVTRECF